MTRAPNSIPRLSPSTTCMPSSGLSNATRRMNPKYTTIIAIVSAIATRHRAAARASKGKSRAPVMNGKLYRKVRTSDLKL